ncbi:FecR family protein [Maribellus maritimus]|uniref:FecR family protein n=1 Tax=Maribellus maritimus TaxID=2870838 RepID=UPI001EEA8A1B|nr:FecR family protein [Maribellus maritimus]MCG6190144.1 DUF4974 domain-containing protein [Maribellus maritimus]
MTKETLIKFMNNQCSEKELEEVIRWANKEATNKASIDWAREDWDSFLFDDKKLSDKTFQKLFDKIQNEINRNDLKEKSNKTIPILNWITRVAAVLLIPVSIFLFYTLTNQNPVYTNQLQQDSIETIAPAGSKTIVQLSDGSIAHLNYGSKLKYPRRFSGKTREVVLAGEGFFDVAHNTKIPFIVKTKKLDIKALGTSFNVSAYPNTKKTETTLVRGKVVLEKKNSEGATKIIGALKPGQHVSYDNTDGKITSSQGSIDKYISWREGKLIFEDAPLTEVAEKLERMFGVEIEIHEKIRDYNYTVTFDNEPLYQILDLMAIATPINYKILPRQKLANGTFSKQKIIIEARN